MQPARTPTRRVFLLGVLIAHVHASVLQALSRPYGNGRRLLRPLSTGIKVDENGKWLLKPRPPAPPITVASRAPVIPRAAPPAEVSSNLSRPPTPAALPRVLSRDEAARELARKIADKYCTADGRVLKQR
jgi:hypothetical protein